MTEYPNVATIASEQAGLERLWSLHLVHSFPSRPRLQDWIFGAASCGHVTRVRSTSNMSCEASATSIRHAHRPLLNRVPSE
jgi:hypothetical protein